MFLLCMPIIAAPLEAVAVLGPSLSSLTLPCILIFRYSGFVLVGIPIYYMTQRSGPSTSDPPLVVGKLPTFSSVVLGG